jgi:hypothetical protein
VRVRVRGRGRGRGRGRVRVRVRVRSSTCEMIFCSVKRVYASVPSSVRSTSS